MSLFIFFVISSRFGILLGKSDLERLQHHISEARKAFSLFTTLPTEQLSCLFETGWPKFRWYIHSYSIKIFILNDYWVFLCLITADLILWPQSMFISQHADVNVNKILIGNKCDMQDQRVRCLQYFMKNTENTLYFIAIVCQCNVIDYDYEYYLVRWYRLRKVKI